MIKQKVISIFLLFLLLSQASVFGQTANYSAPKEDIDKIVAEGRDRSQVMRTLNYLSDVIGPRLTGSPGLKRANEWTRDTLTGWGLENSHLEAWGPFGRGWTLKRFYAMVDGPTAFPVIAYPKAWSPGTDTLISLTGPRVKESKAKATIPACILRRQRKKISNNIAAS